MLRFIKPCDPSPHGPSQNTECGNQRKFLLGYSWSLFIPLCHCLADSQLAIHKPNLFIVVTVEFNIAVWLFFIQPGWAVVRRTNCQDCPLCCLGRLGMCRVKVGDCTVWVRGWGLFLGGILSFTLSCLDDTGCICDYGRT